jgi:uncharacterized protein YbjT (DUF2867 family)
MTRGKVLVTGAGGGQQGRTGRHVAEMLLARGVPVRAFVHRLDERSDRLLSLGAEVVEGDFLDIQSVRRAARGVSSIYFAYPVQDGLLDATAAMALAAREAGVDRLVDLEMLISSPDAPTPRMRQNYLSEQVFEWAGIGAAHLRATVFYENLRVLFRLNQSAQGTIRLPWGDRLDTAIALVAAEDVARVAVGLLTGPPLPAGSAYPLIGAVISFREIIETFGRTLGRALCYEAISDQEWQDGALARGASRHAVEHLSNLWRSLRGLAEQPQTFQVSDTIEALGGAKPKTFATFLREERAALAVELARTA